MSGPVLVHATQEAFWFAAGPAKWRECRKAFSCHGIGGRNGKCDHEVQPGETYLDTGELTDPPFGTLRMCAVCAAKPSSAS